MFITLFVNINCILGNWWPLVKVLDSNVKDLGFKINQMQCRHFHIPTPFIICECGDIKAQYDFDPML